MKIKLQKAKYIYNLCSKRHKEGHLSTFRQILEIGWLHVTRGVGYSKYHFAEMWRKDASWDYKTGFLSHHDYVSKIHEINQRKFHGLTQFKPTEKAFFKLFHIPCVKYIGTLNAEWGMTSDGKDLQTKDDLENLLNLQVGKSICFKLLQGDGGRGFKIFSISREKNETRIRHISNEQEYSPDELFRMLQDESQGGWLLEEFIVQHPVLSALNPRSINTVRMYVFQDSNGKISVPGAFLRIGREDSLTDNSTGGGLVSKIDFSTGTLQQTCEWSPEMNYMPQHPDHKARIEGVVVPFWQDAVTLGKKTLSVLPQTRFVGLDIAITPEGPLMVEVNVQPDSDGLSFVGIQTANLFNS